MKSYDVSIVIVNWKSRHDIETCLQSLVSDIRDSGLNCHMCVVDNSDNCDNIKEFLQERYPAVLYINSGGNIGFGKANNLGFKAVRARYYFIVNPDIKFPQGDSAICRLTRYMEDHVEAGIAGPKLLNFDGSLQYSCYRFPKFFDHIFKRLNLDNVFFFARKRVDRLLMQDFDCTKNIPVDWIMGSAMFVRHEVLEAIQGFDERFFMYFEDCDLCRETWARGYEVHYVADIVLAHKHNRSSAKIPGIRGIVLNPITRIHIKSWFQYFLKWGFRRK